MTTNKQKKSAIKQGDPCKKSQKPSDKRLVSASSTLSYSEGFSSFS